MLLYRLPNPPTDKPTLHPPIGLWSMRELWTGKLESLSVVDGNLEPLPKKLPAIVGLSVPFSAQHSEYVRLAYELSRAGHNVIAGGAHAAAVAAPVGVTNVWTGWGEGVRNIDDLPMVVPTHEEMAPYWKAERPHDLRHVADRWLPIETSRGCNGACGYCGGYKGRWQGHSLVWLAAYFDRLSRAGIDEVQIEDDNAVHDLARFVQIVQLLKRKGLVWSTPNGVMVTKLAECLGALRGSSCRRVSLPFETGSKWTARLMGLGDKWIPREEARVIVCQLRSMNISTCGFFIIGYPGETMDDMKETLAFANSLPLDDRYIYAATPYPGTRLYEECKQKGWLTCDGAELYSQISYRKYVIQTEEFSPKDVEKLILEDRAAALKRRGL